MKIPEGSIPKSLYTDNSESVAATKAQDTEHQIPQEIETINHQTPPSSSNAVAKKAELAMSGQAQAALIQWKAMGDGSVKDLQRDINEYRHQRGMPPIKEDGIYGPETDRAARNVHEDQADLERLQADATNVQTRPGPVAEEQMLEALSKPGEGSSFEHKLAEEIKKKLKQF